MKSFKWRFVSNAVTLPGMYGDGIKEAQRAYIREVCDRRGWSFTELARNAGLSSATLTRFMNSASHKPNLSATTLLKIEQASGMHAPLPTEALPAQSKVRTLPVWGRAAAGLWREVSLEGEYASEYIPVVEDPRFAGRTQYALRVDGPSINKRIADGDYAICVAWDELGVDFKTDQLVHVERTRGGLQEATIKVVRVRGTRIELWPDSTDPRFQEPLQLDHIDGDTEVIVRGLVTGKFSHLV